MFEFLSARLSASPRRARKHAMQRIASADCAGTPALIEAHALLASSYCSCHRYRFRLSYSSGGGTMYSTGSLSSSCSCTKARGPSRLPRPFTLPLGVHKDSSASDRRLVVARKQARAPRPSRPVDAPASARRPAATRPRPTCPAPPVLRAAGTKLPYKDSTYSAEFVVLFLWLLVEPGRLFLGAPARQFRSLLPRSPPPPRGRAAPDGTAPSPRRCVLP